MKNTILMVIAITMILAIAFLAFPATPTSVVYGYPPPPVTTGYPAPITTVSPRNTPIATPVASATYPVIIDHPFSDVGSPASDVGSPGDRISIFQNTVNHLRKITGLKNVHKWGVFHVNHND